MILTKSVLSMLIGFLLSITLGTIFIPILKKFKMSQTLSIYLERTHKKKMGTPTMGGLIFLLATLLTVILFLIFHKMEFSYHLLILIFTFTFYGVIGLIDDLLIIVRHHNKGLTEGAKLLLQLVAAIFFFYFFMKAGNEPLLWIHSLHLKIDIGWIYGVFILFVLAASSNAVNLTDGLDGLAGGLSFLAIFTFGIITWNTGWLSGYQELAMMCFILCGSILGFLLFNVSPAKVFMGDTGSLSLGAFLGALAILTRHEVLLILIGIVFVLETISCIIQRAYYKRTKKRIFPMTPIHHSFEKWGMKESDIVKLFWLIGFLSSMLALIIGVWR